MSARLDDYTPSNAVPWMTLIDVERDQPHILSMQCWCHPVLDQDYDEPDVVSHNVAQ